jgi:hypothetical protein
MPANLHVPDYLILPFGRAVKSDLQKDWAVRSFSRRVAFFSADVSVVFVRTQARLFGRIRSSLRIYPHVEDNDTAILKHMCSTLKSHNPKMTKCAELFLDWYFTFLTALDWMTFGERCCPSQNYSCMCKTRSHRQRAISPTTISGSITTLGRDKINGRRD